VKRLDESGHSAFLLAHPAHYNVLFPKFNVLPWLN
jgi:hypothetical protein